MREVVRFGPTPATVRRYLSGALPGVAVHAGAVPNPRPGQLVMLESAGGGDLSVAHDNQLLIVDSWGASNGQAYDLAQDVRAYLSALSNYRSPTGQLIYAASPSGGVVWMPDPDSDSPRYRQIFRFVTRGRAIPAKP